MLTDYSKFSNVWIVIYPVEPIHRKNWVAITMSKAQWWKRCSVVIVIVTVVVGLSMPLELVHLSFTYHFIEVYSIAEIMWKRTFIRLERLVIIDLSVMRSMLVRTMYCWGRVRSVLCVKSVQVVSIPNFVKLCQITYLVSLWLSKLITIFYTQCFSLTPCHCVGLLAKLADTRGAKCSNAYLILFCLYSPVVPS